MLRIFAFGVSCHCVAYGPHAPEPGLQLVMRFTASVHAAVLDGCSGVSSKIVDVNCGTYATFATAADGHIYAFGLNNYGQLALPGVAAAAVRSQSSVQEVVGSSTPCGLFAHWQAGLPGSSTGWRHGTCLYCSSLPGSVGLVVPVGLTSHLAVVVQARSPSTLRRWSSRWRARALPWCAAGSTTRWC